MDRYIFGHHPGRSIVDLGRTRPEERRRLRAGIDAGEVRALYVHLAEGTDEASRAEFDELVGAGLLTAATVLIHGTALDDAQLGRVKEAGAKLVWSPQSNLRLLRRHHQRRPGPDPRRAGGPRRRLAPQR